MYQHQKIIVYFILLQIVSACKTQSGNTDYHREPHLESDRTSCFASETDPNKIYNVKDFGAKGDGSTDDTQAIQTCFNKIEQAGGGTAYFPHGIYIVSRTSRPGKSWCLYGVDNLTIEGENKLNTFIKLAPLQKKFTRILTLEKNRNIRIKNICLDGNVSRQPHPENPNEHLGGLFVNQTENLTICNSTFINTGGDGIGIRGIKKPSSNILIHNCYFDNNQRNGITLGSGFDGVLIKNCYFGKKIDDSPIDSEPESGICRNVEIAYNQIDTPTIMSLGGYYGNDGMGKKFYVHHNSLANCSVQIYEAKHLLFEDNKIIIDKPKKSAIVCIAYNEDVTIRHNQIDITGKPAVYLVKPAYAKPAIKIDVVQNNIKVSNIKRAAIIVKGVSQVNINDNIISGNKSPLGVYCVSTYPQSGINISNNHFHNFIKGIRIQTLNKNPMDSIAIIHNIFSNVRMTLDTTYYDKNLSPSKRGILYAP